MKIYWRKLFVRVSGYEDAQHAFIVYRKSVRFLNTVNKGPRPEGQIQVIETGWYNRVVIDFWIFIFDFKWFSGKEK